ncbi:MAG: tyrosine-type recombinase/integrase [Spirochaetaceae bacterium]|jgi:site-specific recombinase XerD|nr:tyrosine-type recombinase/integrase [Spirochaetaceae bacterium]
MKRRLLGKEELAELLDGIGIDNAYDLRDRAIYELIYSSGLRVGEVAALKIGDIDFSRREAVVHGKGRRDRLVPISVVARDLLEQYLGKRRERREDAVFIGCGQGRRSGVMSGRNISRRFRKLLREGGIDRRDVSTHSIRHSTATHMLENGASIRHVQELLGHKNIEHTARYTEVLTENILKEYRKYHPREHELLEVVDEEYLERFREVVVERSKGDKA